METISSFRNFSDIPKTMTGTPAKSHQPTFELTGNELWTSKVASWTPLLITSLCPLTNPHRSRDPRSIDLLILRTLKPMTKKEQRASRFLSLILRHDPSVIGIELDSQGWASVDDLLAALQAHRKPLTLNELKTIVHENSKSRFHFSDDGSHIRAAQGHSIEVDLQFTEQTPPDLLYHGTANRFMDLIERQGLMKMSRQHVHLTSDVRIAHDVGRRHGKPIILEVSAGPMSAHGHAFFLSANGVWLTESVPPDYLSRRFSL